MENRIGKLFVIYLLLFVIYVTQSEKKERKKKIKKSFALNLFLLGLSSGILGLNFVRPSIFELVSYCEGILSEVFTEFFLVLRITRLFLIQFKRKKTIKLFTQQNR